jgi:hypothetical protein
MDYIVTTFPDCSIMLYTFSSTIMLVLHITKKKECQIAMLVLLKQIIIFRYIAHNKEKGILLHTQRLKPGNIEANTHIGW